MTAVSEASDLIEGAQVAGVGVRSMHDVLLVQNAKRPLRHVHNFARDSFRQLTLPEAFTSGVVGTLHVWGAVRLGKSEWALAQFGSHRVAGGSVRADSRAPCCSDADRVATILSLCSGTVPWTRP